MDVMLALGILFVVLGHSYQPKIFLLPAYTFQVAVFFFISGYFFRVQENWLEKWRWTIKKAKRLLIPYFILNLFFGILTAILAGRGIFLGEGISWFNFFLTPFWTGHQYFFFLAAWFVPQLFLVHILAQWILWRDRCHYGPWFLFAASCLATYFFSFGYHDIPSAGRLILGRTMLALLFYLSGHIFSLVEERIRLYLVRPWIFAGLYIIYVSLESFWGGFNYFFAFLQFRNGPAVTILGTLSAVFMIYIISHYLAQSLSAKSFIFTIGQNTFSIMAWHLFVFWVINCVLYSFSLIPRAVLSDIFYEYRPERFWFIYVAAGLGVPVLLANGYQKLKEKIAKRFPAYGR